MLNKDGEDKNKRSDHIRYQYDDHYFMTDPDEFIQEFWPHDPKWQLLESPITLDEFEALPFVRYKFLRRIKKLINFKVYFAEKICYFFYSGIKIYILFSLV